MPSSPASPASPSAPLANGTVTTIPDIFGPLSPASSVNAALAETYLRGRGITADLPESLRFHPAAWHGPTARYLPALVARVDDAAGFAIHRTFLRADGAGKADGDKPRAMLGPCAGGHVTLAEAPGRLVVAEGVETALSLACGLLRGPATIWAGLSAPGVAALNLPPVPGLLTIATDGDEAGKAAVMKLAEREGGRLEGRPSACPQGPRLERCADRDARPMTRHDRRQEATDQRKAVLADLREAMKRARPPEPPFRLPASLRDQTVGIVAHWFSVGRGVIHPGMAKLATMSGTSKKTARKNMRVLEAWEALVPVSHERGGRGAATVYQVNLPALCIALAQMNARPSDFLRHFCGQYAAEYPEVDRDFSSLKQRDERSDFGNPVSADAAGSCTRPDGLGEGAETPPLVPEIGPKPGSPQPENPEENPEVSSARIDERYGPAPNAPGIEVGATDQPPLFPSRSAPSREEEEGILLSDPREAAPPTWPRPVDPQLDPTAAHGRAPNGWPRNREGRPIQPDHWVRLSYRERHGTAGLIWNALTQLWEPGCTCG